MQTKLVTIGDKPIEVTVYDGIPGITLNADVVRISVMHCINPDCQAWSLNPHLHVCPVTGDVMVKDYETVWQVVKRTSSYKWDLYHIAGIGTYLGQYAPSPDSWGWNMWGLN